MNNEITNKTAWALKGYVKYNSPGLADGWVKPNPSIHLSICPCILPPKQFTAVTLPVSTSLCYGPKAKMRQMIASCGTANDAVIGGKTGNIATWLTADIAGGRWVIYVSERRSFQIHVIFITFNLYLNRRSNWEGEAWEQKQNTRTKFSKQNKFAGAQYLNPRSANMSARIGDI